MTARPTSSERPDGASRNTSTRRRRGKGRTFSATPATSPRAARVLLRERGQLEGPEEDDLVLELDAVLLPGTPPRLGHQRDRILGARTVGVLDEVGVPGRDLCAADSIAPQATGLEHTAGAELVIGVLENAPVRPLVRRLGGFALCLEVADERLRSEERRVGKECRARGSRE